MKRFVVGACGALIAGACGLSASGATLTGTATTAIPSTVNLTAPWTVDWAEWNYTASNQGASGAPSNRKLGGTSIGNASAVQGTLRGITGTMPTPTYSYSDGTSPTSSGAAALGAITDTVLNVAGPGVRFSVTGDPLTTRTVQVFVAGFLATGTFTATLNGAPVYTDSSITYGGTRSGALYTLDFRPDSVTDVLQMSYVIGSVNAGAANANVDLQAIAVSVPEPGVVSAAGLAVVALGGRRRRR
jgi:hypothetical protein